MSKDDVGTLGQVVEMQPGEKAWINFSFDAIVSQVEEKTSQKGSPFVTATLTDPHNDGITCELAIFGRKTLPFENCLCSFSGQGMRRDEYKGNAKVVGSLKTTINKLGTLPGRTEPANNSNTGQSTDAITSTAPKIKGESVGAAINNAVSIVRERLMPTDLAAAIKYVDSPAFSRDVYTIASDLLRVSEMLQKGKLADSAKERAASPEDKAAAAKAKAEAEAKAKADEEAKKAAEQKRLEEEARKGNQSKAGSQEDFGDVPF